ncbi:MAG: hypothetical protein JXQ91_17520 [Vannielia sp.]|uniref:hypothetical protein n=1 Tax=Vannielia sp. TaxID=2813045 RepID=UPI003B8C19D4
MGDTERMWMWLLATALENPVATVMLAGAAVALVIAAYVAVFYVIPGLLIRAGVRKLESMTAPKDAEGRQVERTVGARVMGQRDIGLLASRGMAKPAEQSLNATVMRTTWGLRLSTVLFSGLAVAMAFNFDPADQMMSTLMPPLIAGMALLALAHVFSYELRYDRDVLISQSLIQFRRERAWKELVDLKDEGRGVYRLVFADGKKMRVQKYLVGMSDFLTLASRHIRGQASYA